MEKENLKEIKIKIDGGYLKAKAMEDFYQGIEVKYIKENEDEETQIHSVLIEYNKDKDEVRAVIWNTDDEDDFNENIKINKVSNLNKCKNCKNLNIKDNKWTCKITEKLCSNTNKTECKIKL